jgi:hypothetical protein
MLYLCPLQIQALEKREPQKAQQVVDSRKLFRVLRVDPANAFVNLITADESWYYWSYDQSSQWNISRDLVQTRQFKTINSEKPMFTVVFSCYKLLALDNVPKWLKVNNQYFCDVILEETRRAVIIITKKSGIEQVMIHMDNCKVHNSAKTTKSLEEFHVTRLPHPPYSSHISPCNFWFLGRRKDVMRGQQFPGPDHVRAF